MKVRSFRDLDVWKLGKNLVVQVYEVTAGFPKTELFGLTAQMRRAAISVPSNVAEGFNRRYPREFKRFLNVALGSCAELETQIELAYEFRYLDEERKSLMLDQLDHECRMLRNLSKRL